mmetsp:Transcript_37587/g.70081  ORF Transcript_37587/g.70081 Transcript_37587/m.70081 type:complete len:418 (+) Transcript_37587:56-1309(+)
MAPSSTLQVCPPAADAGPAGSPCLGNFEPPKRRHCHKGKKKTKEPVADLRSALEALPESFAEDYWNGQTLGRLPPETLLNRLLEAGGKAMGSPVKELKSVDAIVAENQDAWLRRLRKGFSLLFEGHGSKWQLLESFAKTLVRSGADVACFDAFSRSASLAAFFREFLGQMGHQRGGASLLKLRDAVLAARRAEKDAPPLVLVIHNLEAIAPAQQSVVASLAAEEEVWLVASVDSIWADLAWSSDALKDFNFCREEVNTMRGYDVEIKGKYPHVLPAWSDPFAKSKETKVSIGLVLKTLTKPHQELVQEMAKSQLETGAGMGLRELLDVAEDRMIASTRTKLRKLLTELTDHQIVVERQGQDKSAIFVLPVKEAVLRRLANGEAPGGSDSEDGQDEGDAEEVCNLDDSEEDDDVDMSP